MTKNFIVNNNEEMNILTERMLSAKITKPLKIQVSVHKSDRSLSQNNLMWMWYTELRDHITNSTGKVFTTDAIHDHLMKKFLEPKVTIFMNESIETYSTKKLSMKKFAAYLEKIDMHCAESYDLRLTHPEDLFDEAMGRRNA